MATTRVTGYVVTAAVWNAALSSINDAGSIWSGAVAGTTGVFTSGASARPLQLYGSDGATSGIVASLYSNTSTRASALHFSDAFTYNLGIGSDLNGSFNVWAGRSPGVAGTSVFSVAATGNTTIAGVVLGPAGAVGAPTYSFTGDSNTGLYASAADVISLASGGVVVAAAYASATRAEVIVGGNTAVFGLALGAGSVGPNLTVYRNTSGNGAAGVLKLARLDGSFRYVWVDGAGDLRIKSSAPVEDGGTTSDTSGTVVGTQTSSVDTKEVLGAGVAPVEALATILSTPVQHFRYKGGSYSGTTFHGILADDAPAFAMDPDAAHPHGRSFNPVSAFGYTVQAIKALAAQHAALAADVARLQGDHHG